MNIYINAFILQFLHIQYQMRNDRMSVMNWENAVMAYFNVFQTWPEFVAGNAGNSDHPQVLAVR
jgi:hypothetical protein